MCPQEKGSFAKKTRTVQDEKVGPKSRCELSALTQALFSTNPKADPPLSSLSRLHEFWGPTLLWLTLFEKGYLGAFSIGYGMA